MSFDTFPFSAERASDLRTQGLLANAAAGPKLIEHFRDLALQSSPTKRRISAGALRGLLPYATRDLTAASASGGGYLVSTSASPFEELVKRYSVLHEAGLNITSDLLGPVVIPRLKTQAAAGWLSAEGTNITESDPAFGQLALTPKFIAIKIDCSRTLLLQGDAEQIIGQQALEAVARGIDAAIFSGTGASGQPTGILNTAGVTAQSGTSLAAAGLRSMRKAVALAGAREDRMLWIGAPDVQETLGAREFSAGSGRPLWDDGKILGRPAIASSLVAAGTLVLGDFSRCTLGVFDRHGLAVECNPYESFQSGLVSFRLIAAVDIGISPAAAFAVSTSIT